MNKQNLTFIEELKNIIREKHLLKHPFYRAWEAGTLPIETLREYAKQYYHLEKNFPRFLSQIHARLDDPDTRQVVLKNLCDEELGNENHRELWTRFGEMLGASRGEIQNDEPLTETSEAVAAFRALAEHSPLAGIAALAAYESQIPEVAETKLRGLAEHYGLTDKRGTTFFRVHQKLDVEHSNEWWDIIEREATTADKKTTVIEAVIEARDRLWGFLDGICRVCLPA